MAKPKLEERCAWWEIINQAAKKGELGETPRDCPKCNGYNTKCSCYYVLHTEPDTKQKD